MPEVDSPTTSWEDAAPSLMFPILVIVVVAVVAGFLAGGSLKPFERLRVHWWGLAPLGLALQGAPVPELARVSRNTFATVMLLGSYAALLAFAAVNRRLPGAWLILIGLALNLAVIAPNGGMPVDPVAMRAAGATSVSIQGDAKHHLMTGDDVLTFLGDRLPAPAPIGAVLSVGDIVLYSGIAWFVISLMLGRARENARPPARWFPMYRGKHLSPARRGLPPSPPHRAPAVAARWGTAR
jgi:hypothetical protein